jgi:hypothetical protein
MPPSVVDVIIVFRDNNRIRLQLSLESAGLTIATSDNGSPDVHA